ncbi:MAG: leucine-rich repeat domain-containing protein [Clostridia bacterium]|mgnify:CR=1 FL=1|nr:leucine-rich repeat domain-containing protein [Clostridia bacterium]
MNRHRSRTLKRGCALVLTFILSATPWMNALAAPVEQTQVAIEDLPVEEGVSEHIVSENVTPQEGVSENSIPENPTPENFISENTTPENPISDNTISEDSVSEDTVSENAVSENIVSDNEISEEGFVIDKDGVLTEYTGTATDIVIPEGVKVIAANVFKNKGITSVVFPKGLVTIGNYAFMGCPQGTKMQAGEITIPATVEYIGSYAFEKSTYLTHNDTFSF